MVPMYVREISQDDIRGVLGSFIILFQNIGILAMFAMGAYLDYYTVLWIVVWVPVLNFVMMIRAPESPAFLVKRGRIEVSCFIFSSILSFICFGVIISAITMVMI